jgi:hypothetical protein
MNVDDASILEVDQLMLPASFNLSNPRSAQTT